MKLPHNKELHELDTVVLSHDIERYGLKQGDVGSIVHCYSDDETVEVEFVTAEGKTIALLTLTSNDVRSMDKEEILHVRSVRRFATL